MILCDKIVELEVLQVNHVYIKNCKFYINDDIGTKTVTN